MKPVIGMAISRSIVLLQLADCRYTRATANWQSDRGAGADNVSVWPLHLELRREAKDDRVQLSCEVDTYASFGF